MIRFPNPALPLAALILALATPAFAQKPAPSPSPGAPAKARFSGASAYTGAPNLALTLAMIEAGGGAAAFDSKKLLGVSSKYYINYSCTEKLFFSLNKSILQEILSQKRVYHYAKTLRKM